MTDEELDGVLGAFRDDVPVMSEQAFLIGQLRLEAAAQPKPEPIEGCTPLPVRFEVVNTKRSRRSPPRRKIAPWMTVAAAVAVAAAGTLIVVSGDDQPIDPLVQDLPVAQAPVKPPKPKPVYPPAPARPPVATDAEATGGPLPAPTAVFNGAGELAEHVSDPPQIPGKYLYLERREIGRPYPVPGPDASTITKSERNEGYWREWVPTDRAGVWQVSRDVSTSVANPPLAQDPQLPTKISGLSRWEGTFQAPKGDYFPGPGNWFEPNSQFIAGLPRDAKELYNRLAHDSAGGYDPTADSLKMAGELLSRPVPTDLRRALYQALSYHPWLKVTENVQTSDHRRATSLSIDERFTERSVELLVDPDNGRLLALQTKPLNSSVRQVTEEFSLHWSVVDKLGATS